MLPSLGFISMFFLACPKGRLFHKENAAVYRLSKMLGLVSKIILPSSERNIAYTEIKPT
jgi:hypothetical protein